MKELIVISKNGKKVWHDPVESHASTHIAKTSQLLEEIKGLIPSLDLEGERIRDNVELDSVIGKTGLVETTDDDEVVYALRPKRQAYSRFVKGKEPQETRWMTFDIRKSDEDNYYIYTVFVGKDTPSFPGGEHLPEQSRDFWSKHALVWGSQEVLEDTVTTDCPW